MSVPSPTCTVDGNPTPVDVTANASHEIELANVTGADFWSVSCTSTDETSSASSVNASISINQTTKKATFTSTGLGTALIFTSTVGITGLGLDANGKANSAFTTTFKVNIKAANGNRVMALNETIEQSAVAGWGAVINPLLRALGNPLGGNGAPLAYQTTSPAVSAASSFSLSAAQQATPIIPLTGTVPGGGTTITLPNTVGAAWTLDLSAVTLTGSLTFTTGSGTTAVVASADIGSHKRLIEVVVSASNVVSWG